MLQKAEESGFIEKGTVKDIRMNEVWKNSYLPKCKLKVAVYVTVPAKHVTVPVHNR